MKKIFPLLLALLVVVPVSASTTISTSGGNATANFSLTAEPTTMNVTVPTSLSIEVSSDTVATVGTGSITNNSPGIVEVKSITLNEGTFALASYASQAVFNTYNIDSKQLGLSIAFGGATGELTSPAQTYVTGTDFTSGVTKSLAAGTLKIASASDTAHAHTLAITPVASVSPIGNTAISTATEAASMVLVIGWYTGT